MRGPTGRIKIGTVVQSGVVVMDRLFGL